MLNMIQQPRATIFEGASPLMLPHALARNLIRCCRMRMREYDNHMGRVNYAHQTPIGVAKLHSSNDAVNFLNGKYVALEDALENGRNPTGDIWWDKELDYEIELFEDIKFPINSGDIIGKIKVDIKEGETIAKNL